MRHRWIRETGLGPAFLAAAILAVSPMPVAAAQRSPDARRADSRAFWEQPALWLNHQTPKALRDTDRPGSWEVLVAAEKDGQWAYQGFLTEISRSRPQPNPALDADSKALIESFEVELLTGEVRTSQGRPLYVVAALFADRSLFRDSLDGTLKRLVPLHVAETYEEALRFAQTYEKVYDGSLGAGQPPAADSEKDRFGCIMRCDSKFEANADNCDATLLACVAAVTLAAGACAVSCGGFPPCEAICLAAFLAGGAACALSFTGCSSTASQLYEQCVGNCGAGGCSATATHTTTSWLSLETATGRGRKLTASPVDFPLERAESRGEESFVMDEWAVVENGRVKASSNPAFGWALTEQGAAPAQGSLLVIQEPVHDTNSRHVPKPEVRINGAKLAASENGQGGIVAARLELSSARTVDRVEILYSSEPVEKTWKTRMEKLVSQRVQLAFASEKEHRTAVYVVLRLSDRFELLGTFTAFPKCCCGGEFCV